MYMSKSYRELLAEFSASERMTEEGFLQLVYSGIQDKQKKQIRDKRDSELNKTDKYAALDFPHPNKDKRNQWLKYRQELRDLPANIKNMKNVVWPEEPDMVDSQDVYKYDEDMDTQLGNLKTDIESKREQLEAVIQSTRTHLEVILQSTHTQFETNFRSVSTQLETTQTDLQNAQTDLQTTRTDLQTTRTDLQTTRSQLDETRIELEAEKVKVRNLDARLGIVEQSLASILSNLNV
jgi:chromosome segregation ATPase